MKRVRVKCNALAFLVAGVLAAAPAFADKPSRGDGDRGERHEQGDRRGGDRAGHDGDRRESYERGMRDERRHDVRFSDEHRWYLHEYYAERFRMGRCPPGLMKKHNGCMPPGQARKWRMGYPLPPGLIYYDLPPGVLIQLGPPPHGYRYVRVASDILLIAIGTGMVMDAIEDLGRQ